MSDRNEALRLADNLPALFDNDLLDSTDVKLAASELRRLTAEQAVMRQWIAEALPMLGSIDSEGECHALDFIVSHQLLRSLVESGRRLVDGGPDDLLAVVE